MNKRTTHVLCRRKSILDISTLIQDSQNIPKWPIFPFRSVYTRCFLTSKRRCPLMPLPMQGHCTWMSPGCVSGRQKDRGCNLGFVGSSCQMSVCGDTVILDWGKNSSPSAILWWWTGNILYTSCKTACKVKLPHSPSFDFPRGNQMLFT